MEELLPPGVSLEDWDATPLSVRTLLVTLIHELRDLKAKLNLTSQNSSKPPSSDSPSAPPRAVTPPRGRKAGAQTGHPGVTREPPTSDQITAMVDIYPTHCPDCQTAIQDRLTVGQTISTAWRRCLYSLVGSWQLAVGSPGAVC